MKNRSFNKKDTRSFGRRDHGVRGRNNLQSPYMRSRANAKESQRSYSMDLTDIENEKMDPKAEVKIIVGAEDSDVKTIAEAIELAEPGTVIKLNEGRYRESIKITKPGLRIEPRMKKKDEAVYLLGEEGPCITIDLKPNETCVIKGIIMAHFGSNIANKFNEQIKDNDLQSANPKFLKQFDVSKEMDCVIMVLGGNLIIRNSLISLKSLPENIKSMIPA